MYFTFGRTDQVTTLPKFVLDCVWAARGSGGSYISHVPKDIGISAHGRKSSK